MKFINAREFDRKSGCSLRRTWGTRPIPFEFVWGGGPGVESPGLSRPYCLTAMAEISIFAPPINPATWTVALAGLGSGMSAL